MTGICLQDFKILFSNPTHSALAYWYADTVGRFLLSDMKENDYIGFFRANAPPGLCFLSSVRDAKLNLLWTKVRMQYGSYGKLHAYFVLLLYSRAPPPCYEC